MLDVNMFLPEFLKTFPLYKKVPVNTSEIEKYLDVLPKTLLDIWKNYGFAGFGNGLYWFTNPSDYKEILENFLKDTKFLEMDEYYVFARNIYGDLYLWGKKTGHSLTLKPTLNWVITEKGSEKMIKEFSPDYAFGFYLYALETEDIDYESKSGAVFPKISKKISAISEEDALSFTPYLYLGGKINTKSLEKTNLFVMLDQISNTSKLEIVDMSFLVAEAINNH